MTKSWIKGVLLLLLSASNAHAQQLLKTGLASDSTKPAQNCAVISLAGWPQLNPTEGTTYRWNGFFGGYTLKDRGIDLTSATATIDNAPAQPNKKLIISLEGKTPNKESETLLSDHYRLQFMDPGQSRTRANFIVATDMKHTRSIGGKDYAPILFAVMVAPNLDQKTPISCDYLQNQDFDAPAFTLDSEKCFWIDPASRDSLGNQFCMPL